MVENTRRQLSPLMHPAWRHVEKTALNDFDAVDWDVLNTNVPKDVTRAAWDDMFAQCAGNLSLNSNYQKLQGNNADRSPNPTYTNLLDVPAYIDYMIHNIWACNNDWANRPEPNDKNWYVGFNRVYPDGYKFHDWDAEFTLNLDNARGNVNQSMRR